MWYCKAGINTMDTYSCLIKAARKWYKHVSSVRLSGSCVAVCLCTLLFKGGLGVNGYCYTLYCEIILFVSVIKSLISSYSDIS